MAANFSPGYHAPSATRFLFFFASPRRSQRETRLSAKHFLCVGLNARMRMRAIRQPDRWLTVKPEYQGGSTVSLGAPLSVSYNQERLDIRTSYRGSFSFSTKPTCSSLHNASESGCLNFRCHFSDGYCIQINSFPRVPISSPRVWDFSASGDLPRVSWSRSQGSGYTFPHRAACSGERLWRRINSC